MPLPAEYLCLEHPKALSTCARLACSTHHHGDTSPLQTPAHRHFLARPSLCRSTRVPVPKGPACLSDRGPSHPASHPMVPKSTMGSQSNPNQNLPWSLELPTCISTATAPTPIKIYWRWGEWLQLFKSVEPLLDFWLLSLSVLPITTIRGEGGRIYNCIYNYIIP